ncbi:hypothetical protein N7513_003555 [Penicillium frequentans]|nr:hypothetical protein N7513_004715 [Penicillium glabrum]KAJ5555913.1 hypothetical protein N7513_003555 [Penicillium glabrum]
MDQQFSGLLHGAYHDDDGGTFPGTFLDVSGPPQPRCISLQADSGSQFNLFLGQAQPAAAEVAAGGNYVDVVTLTRYHCSGSSAEITAESAFRTAVIDRSSPTQIPKPLSPRGR